MATEKVIPTAWILAHGRTFSDIPYSKEIFEEFELIRKSKGEIFSEELQRVDYAPNFEARYKLANKLLKETKINQILEVASGLSPRGLEMVENSSTLKYVEMDFLEILEEKKIILEKIYRKLGKTLPTNLFFEDGNALFLEDLKRACRYFNKDEPIIVINEGLMRYLTFDQKTIYANNVHKLLEEFGGFWITPDISLNRKASLEELGLESKTPKTDINKLTGINIGANFFKSEYEARIFFQNLGFTIESHSFMEVEKELVSPKKVNMNPKQVEGMMGHNVVFVMKVLT